MLEENKIYHGDCLEVMQAIDDESIDLIILDPPYNIKKAKWDKIENYNKFLSDIFKVLSKKLKGTGSLYIFHNDFDLLVSLYLILKSETVFILRNFLVWNKKFNNCRMEGFLQGYLEIAGLRSYEKMYEFILFLTFQDGTGLLKVKHDTENFKPLRTYFKNIQEFMGLSLLKINKTMGNRRAEHCFYWRSTQWELPTLDTYQALIDAFKIDAASFFRPYEDLRLEYEDLRYTFNNQKTHHSVWNYSIDHNKISHPTVKPVPLIENIIKHSSNEEDLILDPFGGSGTTGVASQNLNRRCILIEK